MFQIFSKKDQKMHVSATEVYMCLFCVHMFSMFKSMLSRVAADPSLFSVLHAI